MRRKHDSKSAGEMVEDVCTEMEYVMSVFGLVEFDCSVFLGMYACEKAAKESALAASMRGSGRMGGDIAGSQWGGVRVLVAPLALLHMQSFVARSLSCIHTVGAGKHWE